MSRLHRWKEKERKRTRAICWFSHLQAARSNSISINKPFSPSFANTSLPYSFRLLLYFVIRFPLWLCRQIFTFLFDIIIRWRSLSTSQGESQIMKRYSQLKGISYLLDSVFFTLIKTLRKWEYFMRGSQFEYFHTCSLSYNVEVQTEILPRERLQKIKMCICNILSTKLRKNSIETYSKLPSKNRSL